MVDPRGLTLRDWADSMVLTSPVGQPIGRLNGADWQRWAANFVKAPGYSQRSVPDPYQFDDWREWAMRAYLSLEGVN